MLETDIDGFFRHAPVHDPRLCKVLRSRAFTSQGIAPEANASTGC